MLNTTLVNRKQALKVVKELDAFPKVPESYQETSAAGGGWSLITFLLIGILILSEVSYYTATELQFEYKVDTNITGKVRLNIDMTVAMKCQHIGADILDQTGQDVFGFGQLKEDPVFWELSEDQERQRSTLRHQNEYLTNEYHAIQDVLWTSKSIRLKWKMPKR
uniref:Endoplasmic reticulum vesicle transporter N-terminal domain-containing protein n=1 Tax=Arion vulgaris TaxID=1028688 RepID=A0A0B6Y6M0_9EUPU